MRAERGDIWELHTAGATICVTTNIGWDEEMRNNMGAGLALQAMSRWPWLPTWYGAECYRMATAGEVRPLWFAPLRLILLPVKPLLDPAHPERSWDQKANPEFIRQQLLTLRLMTALPHFPARVALTLPGCGNGALHRDEVGPILHETLGGLPGFTLCDLAI